MSRVPYIHPLALLTCSMLEAQAAASNPFFKDWSGPFGMPPFAEIRNEPVLPALQRGIEGQRKEVLAIAADPRMPDSRQHH